MRRNLRSTTAAWACAAVDMSWVHLSSFLTDVLSAVLWSSSGTDFLLMLQIPPFEGALWRGVNLMGKHCNSELSNNG